MSSDFLDDPQATQMHHEQAFHQAMLANPEDTALRLVFADWLEERGDPRSELIRLLHTLTQSVEVPERSKLEDRLRSLVAAGVEPIGPFWTNSIGMKFAWIPAGTFLMGSPEDEEGRYANETQHRVTLTKGFYLAIHPVTQTHWRKVMGGFPSHFQGHDRPVEQVSWGYCQQFVRALGEADGNTYSLPTEARWEFACRAGTTTPFYFGKAISTEQANYNGNYPYGTETVGLYRQKTTPVFKFRPNAFGLYDMHGNLNEWCADWCYRDYSQAAVVDPQGPETGQFRMLRGGAYLSEGMYLRAAFRLWGLPSNSCSDFGFRPVRLSP